jgi:hypothetical protein
MLTWWAVAVLCHNNIHRYRVQIASTMPETILGQASVDMNQVPRTATMVLDCKVHDEHETPLAAYDGLRCAILNQRWTDCKHVYRDYTFPCPEWYETECECTSVLKVIGSYMEELRKNDWTGTCPHCRGQEKVRKPTKDIVEEFRREQKRKEEIGKQKPTWRYEKKRIEDVECLR